MIVRLPLLVICFFFLTGGIAHFVLSDFFIKAMPSYLEYHRELVAISGVFEVVGAIGILIPKVRLISAYGLITLCIAVFPANLNMALHPEQFSSIPAVLLWLRLPLQVLLIWFIVWAIKPKKH